MSESNSGPGTGGDVAARAGLDLITNRPQGEELSLGVTVKFVYVAEMTISRADYNSTFVNRVEGTARLCTNAEIQQYEENNDEMTLMEQLMEAESGTLYVKVEDA
jgi:hypothetical protein